MTVNGQRLFAAGIVAAMLIAIPAMAQAQKSASSENHAGPPAQTALGELESERGEADPQQEASFANNIFSVRGDPVSATSLTQLQLWGANNSLSNDWTLRNSAANNSRFEIMEGSAAIRAVMLKGGNFGLGTVAPTHRLTVQNPDNIQALRLIGPNSFGHGARLNFGDQNYVFIDEPEDDLMRIHGHQGVRLSAGGTDTGPGTDPVLLARANGVGIGTASPNADLEVNNLGGPQTNIRFINPGVGSWANAVVGGGNFAFNKLGSGAIDTVFRERNHALATLDVDGAVIATSYKVRSTSASAQAQRAKGKSGDEVDLVEVIEDLQKSNANLRTRVAELEAKLGE